MQSTGIVRKVDALGRFVLPSELRQILEINENDPLEILREGNTIILKKYVPSCVFCGQSNANVTYKGRNVCADCLRELRDTL